MVQLADTLFDDLLPYQNGRCANIWI